jgi:hypothetical protein
MRKFLIAIVFSFCGLLHAWDYEGHRILNLAAVDALPGDFPAFAKTPNARDRIGFLSGEPDRWRSTPDYTLRHCNNPDHYFDVEDLIDLGLRIEELSQFRYVFLETSALAREKNKARLKWIDPAQNLDRTRELIGFLPWTIAETFARMKAALSYWKAYKEGGTVEEIENAEENVIYYMGILGHYIGDLAQPLHTTRNFNGWVDANPRNYTTNKAFHSWVDGYPGRAGMTEKTFQKKMRPGAMVKFSDGAKADNIFPLIAKAVSIQHRNVETIYELDRGKKLGPTSRDGQAFITEQLLFGSQMLADLWQTAWVTSPPDQFLKSKLAQRVQEKSRGGNRGIK